jgi:PAS domain S-box-containing protein
LPFPLKGLNTGYRKRGSEVKANNYRNCEICQTQGRRNRSGTMTRNGTSAPESTPVDSVPWGTHIGVLYRNRQELAESVICFIRRGLERNACCVWVTSTPLNVSGAERVLRKSVPELGSYLDSSRIILQDYREVYQGGEGFDPATVVNHWIAAEEWALEQGYDGLFLISNTSWLEKGNWEPFTRFEAAFHGIIKSRRIIAMNTYSLRKCGIAAIMDVATGHDFILVKRDGRWKGIGNTARGSTGTLICGREERLRQIAQTSADVVFTCDNQGTLSFVSHTVEKLFGYTPGDVIGRNGTEFILPRFERELREFGARLQSEPDGAWLQAEVRCSDGSSATVEIHASPIRGDDMVVGYEGVCRDITDRVLFRRHAYDQIEKNIEQFAILGDHIRHPLQVIQARADLLNDETASGKIAEQVQRINEIVRQLDEGWLESRKIRDFLLKNEPAEGQAPRRQKKSRAAGHRRKAKLPPALRMGFPASQQTLYRYINEELARSAR